MKHSDLRLAECTQSFHCDHHDHRVQRNSCRGRLGVSVRSLEFNSSLRRGLLCIFIWCQTNFCHIGTSSISTPLLRTALYVLSNPHPCTEFCEVAQVLRLMSIRPSRDPKRIGLIQSCFQTLSGLLVVPALADCLSSSPMPLPFAETVREVVSCARCSERGSRTA